MANFVNYSPWQDAASYGQGLGQVLGQILLQGPQRKAEFQMEKDRFPLEQQLLGAQIDQAKFRPQYQQEQLDLKNKLDQSTIQNRTDTLDLKTMILALQQAANDWKEKQGQQNADARTTTANADMSRADTAAHKQPPPPSSSTVETQNNIVGKVLPQIGTAEYGGTNSAIPLDVLTAAQKLMAQSKGGNPLDILKPFVAPNLQTNQPGMWDSGGPTVTTNGAAFAVPPSMQNTNTPAAGGQMLRVKSPSGQTGQIPAGQLQQALTEGYQLVQ